MPDTVFDNVYLIVFLTLVVKHGNEQVLTEWKTGNMAMEMWNIYIWNLEMSENPKKI